MRPVFGDTSYYIALLSEADDHHEAAIALANRIHRKTIVTEYVLVELGNALSRSRHRARFGSFVDCLLTDPQVSFVPASTALFRQASDLYTACPDKTWSLVDCASFVVMRQRRLVDALTADQHFQQAGFNALLLQGSAGER